jgi:hypothetical protein
LQGQGPPPAAPLPCLAARHHPLSKLSPIEGEREGKAPFSVGALLAAPGLAERPVGSAGDETSRC